MLKWQLTTDVLSLKNDNFLWLRDFNASLLFVTPKSFLDTSKFESELILYYSSHEFFLVMKYQNNLLEVFEN